MRRPLGGLFRGTARLVVAVTPNAHLRSLAGVVAISLLSFTNGAYPQSQSSTRFEYDGAGNIVRIITETNLAPPAVSSLTPGFINRGGTVTVVALGDNLALASVSTSNPELLIDNVSATKNAVQFRLTATLDAVIGPAPIEFTTGLGTATADIIVAERVPVIATEPNPILLEPDGQPVQVTLLFDAPFATDQTYLVSVSDTAIATIQQTSVVLLAGEREVSVDISGISVGNTTFNISQPENFLGLGIPVIVIEAEPLPLGTYQFQSLPLGVVINIDQPLSGPVSGLSEGVGVVINIDQPLSGPVSGLSEGVGVVINIDQPLSGSVTALPEDIGVAFGATGVALSPPSFAVNTAGTLTISGTGMDEVTAVSFFPAEGITQTGPISVNGDGTELSVPLAIDALASPGIRAILLTTAAGDVGIEPSLEITP